MKKQIYLSKITLKQIEEMGKIIGGNDNSTCAPLTDCGNCLPVQDKVCSPPPILTKVCTLGIPCVLTKC
ncbi:MAG: hypothetical protein GX879_07590 [Bacteroidales bacterium]|nr:hypothetical protein [Bacteroidales bacterium]